MANLNENNMKEHGNASSLMEREKEYQRLNAELEAQTAKLVEEAENMMKRQDTFLRQVSPSSEPSSNMNIQTVVADSILLDSDSNCDDPLTYEIGGFQDENDPKEFLRKDGEIVSSRTIAKKVLKKTSSKNSARHKKLKPSSFSFEPSGDGFVASDELNLVSEATEHIPVTSQLVKMRPTSQVKEIMPKSAEGMSSEAQLTFLKAKVRVMQEELEVQAKEARSLSEERDRYKSESKSYQEEVERLKKGFSSLEEQVQKLKRGLDDARKKTDSKSIQYQAVTKEVESLKRERKLAATTQSTTEVRLNRAVEENEKLKSLLEKLKHSNKERTDHDHQEREKLQAENKRLERLRNDSLTVMSKQQKLIGILKRQILHIEAAKLLSFTEAEFMKALDWGNK